MRQLIVSRNEDMSAKGRLVLMRQVDGDIIVSVQPEWPDGSLGDASAVEFCSPGAGGGRSAETHAALEELMNAMVRDNKARHIGTAGAIEAPGLAMAPASDCGPALQRYDLNAAYPVGGYAEIVARADGGFYRVEDVDAHVQRKVEHALAQAAASHAAETEELRQAKARLVQEVTDVRSVIDSLLDGTGTPAMVAAINTEFPEPDTPHTSVRQRAADARLAMKLGWSAACRRLAEHLAAKAKA